MNYEQLLKHVLDNGTQKMDRTGTGTLSIFGARMEYDLKDGFPLITTKKVHFHAILIELLWFLRGDTNIRYLKEHGVSIWDEWADAEGELGPVYGSQWRSWGKTDLKEGIDQLRWVLDEIRSNPSSRRLVVSAWNVEQIPDMKLPPCHTLFQFHVNTDSTLDLQLYQRSGDLFLGVPFNIASYSLLLLLTCKLTGLLPGRFIHILGDTHIYLNHIEQVKEQITRTPYPFPTITLSDRVISNYEDFLPQDIQLNNYIPHPALRGKVSV